MGLGVALAAVLAGGVALTSSQGIAARTGPVTVVTAPAGTAARGNAWHNGTVGVVLGGRLRSPRSFANLAPPTSGRG
jgi:hypothetical protein